MAIERLCADALVDAERRIEVRLAERVPLLGCCLGTRVSCSSLWLRWAGPPDSAEKHSFEDHQPPALAVVSSGRGPMGRSARHRVVAGCREPWAQAAVSAPHLDCHRVEDVPYSARRKHVLPSFRGPRSGAGFRVLEGL